MNPISAPSSKRRGFTLIELLAAVAIIGVLAGLVLAALGKSREAARASQCLSNVRQIGGLFTLYAADNKGLLPHTAGGQLPGDGAGWSYALARYFITETQRSRFQNIGLTRPNTTRPPAPYYCPAANTFLKQNPDPQREMASYAANGHVLNPSSGTLLLENRTRLANIRNPAQTYLVTDLDGRDFISSRPGYFENGGHNPAAKDRHAGKLNMLFVDGSVRALEFAKMPFVGTSFFNGDSSRAPWGPN